MAPGPTAGEIPPETSFLSLPQEIRDGIYWLLLISPGPVTVFPASAIGPLFRCSTPGLLRASRAIATEAAALFYKCNVFNLEQPARTRTINNGALDNLSSVDCWDALYSFLLVIGTRNRACLRHLEIGISQPKPVSVDAQGSVSSRDPTSRLCWLRQVHTRDQHARTYPYKRDDKDPMLSVDHISPAIEAVFRLLGPEGAKVQLTLLMENLYLPLLNIMPNGCLWGWSGEVPNFIEMARRRFTGGSHKQPRVEVLWKGSHWKSEFMLRIEIMRKDGWEILEAYEKPGPLPEWNFGPTTYFTLQRNCNGSPAFCPTDFDDG